jgi:hypothetical protein
LLLLGWGSSVNLSLNGIPIGSRFRPVREAL